MSGLTDNLAGGDLEKAAREFIDALSPGSWEEFSREGKQVVLDNIGTGVIVEGRPTLTCEQISEFTFPIA
jgi:hypothetical protein